MSQAIGRPNLVDSLVDRLTAEIVGGKYDAGEMLPPERELAATYQVTRTSLKHAFVRLAQLGLLETKHGAGTRVRDFEKLGGPELLPVLVRAGAPGWLGQIFAARREIGALIAAQAAEHADSRHHRQLRTLLAAIESAATPDAVQLADCELHRVLADATGNRVYRLLVNVFLDTYLPVRHLLIGPFEDPVGAAARIRPVVDAVCEGNSDKAHVCARAYMDATQRLMMATST